MGNMMNVAFSFDEASVYNVRELNSTFAVGSLRVMYTGPNRNGSFMSRSTVEEALPSLYNVPIVCHWDPEIKEIGSHDMELVTDDDGNMRIRNLTEPCGVVPESASFRFEIAADANGVEHEYLVADGVYLWKRQDVVPYIMEELGGKIDHSMEIHVLDGDYDDVRNLYVIRRFEFTALCLLGSAEPCFEGSELEVFSTRTFKKKMEQMMADLKETFCRVTPAEQDNDITESDRKGGEVLEYNEKEVFEATEAETNAMESAETAEQAAEATCGECAVVQDAAVDQGGADADCDPADVAETEDTEAVEDRPEENSEDKFALSQQIRDEIAEELGKVTIEGEFGEWPRYWLMDYDQDLAMVYCYDSVDWKLYGFAYEMDGDHVVIDWESRQRMKIAIVPFDEGEQRNPIADVFQAAVDRFQTVSAQVQTADAELNELREFKRDTERRQKEQEIAEVFSGFADLDGDETFESLRNSASEYDAETLREKCFAIRGRKQPAPMKAQVVGSTKMPIAANDSLADEPYNGIFVKYGFSTR